MRETEPRGDLEVDLDTVADALTDTEEDTDADNLGLREELDCAVSEFVAREEGTELRDTD